MALFQFVGQYVDHSSSILDVTKNLFMNPELSDITFIIKGQSFPAHRLILATRFEYFRIMLYGGFSEANKSEIELDVDPDAFKVILEYVYTGIINMRLYTEETLVNVLNLANEYCCDDLMPVLLTNICQRFNKENYGIIMNVAILYSQDTFYNSYLNVLDENANEILQHECFKLLRKEAVADILKRDTFGGSELNIFKAVMKWSETHTEDELKYVIPHIRFNLMQIEDLRTHVQPSGVLSDKEIDLVIDDIKTVITLPFRDGNTHRIQQDYLRLSPDSMYGDVLKISDGEQIRKPSYFKLQKERLINHIFMDLGEYVCSYHVEVSADCREWKRIIDYNKYKCYSLQFLYFEIVPVRYICIVPHYMEKGYYRIHKIETNYIKGTVPMLFDGFVAPIYYIQRTPSGQCDAWKYNSDLSLITISKKITDPAFITFFLHQPVQINSIYLRCEHSKFKVLKIEVAVEENNFTELPFNIDANKCIDFESSLVNFMRLTFSHRPRSGKLMKMIYYFHPGKSGSPYRNWSEYLAEVRRTGKII